jgi:hypothetical protein
MAATTLWHLCPGWELRFFGIHQQLKCHEAAGWWRRTLGSRVPHLILPACGLMAAYGAIVQLDRTNSVKSPSAETCFHSRERPRAATSAERVARKNRVGRPQPGPKVGASPHASCWRRWHTSCCLMTHGWLKVNHDLGCFYQELSGGYRFIWLRRNQRAGP